MNTLKDSNLIIDLDGTLISGDLVLPGARRLLDLCPARTVVASNNSTDTAMSLSARLRTRGLDIPPDRLLLAGEAALSLLRGEYSSARIMLIATAEVRRFAAEAGLRLVEREADIVCVCRDTAFDFEKLSRAAREVARGAVLIAANMDTSHPGPDGLPVPETGALVAAIQTCAGRAPSKVIGKPAPFLFEEALRRLSATPDSAIVIGDNKATDIAGASGLGLRSLLIGPGPDADAASLNDMIDRLVRGDCEPTVRSLSHAPDAEPAARHDAVA